MGAISCAFLAGPWARSEAQQEQYKIAGYLLALRVLLWALTWIANRFFFAKKTYLRDPDELDIHMDTHN